MRNLYLLLGAVTLLLPGCLVYKELPVEYDYSYKGNFKNYRSFNLMQSANLNDTSTVNTIITKSIISRMKFLGYKQTENKPHLLITYRMFPDSLLFNGYTQPEIEQWLSSKNESLTYDKKKIDLKTGTLLIQLYDRRQNRSIWQGYSTTLYGAIDFNDHRNVRNAVISILDKYRIWAEGFIEGNAYKQNEEVNN